MTRGLAILAVSCLTVSALSASDAQNPTFSSKVEAVRVDVLVTNGTQAVRGLTTQDFEITDNGVPQRVDLVSADEIPLNVILVLDTSDSVSGERLEQLQSASEALLSGLQPDDQAALVTFSEQVNLGAPLSTNRDAVRTALQHAVGAGASAVADAVYAGMMIGESDAGRALVIVFGDGLDTASWLTSGKVTEIAKRTDAVVYAVAVRSRVKPELLNELADLTGGRLYEVERTQNFSKVFVDILNEFRMRYLVSYTPVNVAQDGWHRLEVRVKGRRATVRARPGYLAGR